MARISQSHLQLPRLHTNPLSSGHFHADEALAVYLLRLLPTYQPSSLLRTRDPALLSTCHTVVDVGGDYSPENNRYDHHQRTFNATFPSRLTKLSSAGLVYLHFGKEIIARRTKLSAESTDVQVLWEKLYADFVEALDAQDNGISVYDPAQTKDLEKRFNDYGVSLGSLVGDLNHDYSDDDDEPPGPATPQPHEPGPAQAAEDTRFLQASAMIGTAFVRKLTHYHRAWLPARALVTKAYTALPARPSPLSQILILPSGAPWKDHLSALESAHPDRPPVLYVLYPESAEPAAKWRLQAVPVSDGFESRKALPEKWRGVREKALDELTGVPGGVFVHASGFIGGNETREGALEMARRAVEL